MLSTVLLAAIPIGAAAALSYAFGRYHAGNEQRALKRMLDAEDERAETARKERALRRAEQRRAEWRWN